LSGAVITFSAVEDSEPGKARRLPPGPHGLPPELVARNQRERLIAAMAEVCAKGGYEGATVTDVVRRAGVSTASFYRQFKDRRECMLVSFEELFGRLLGEIERTCGAEVEPASKARAGIRTAATLLAGDAPTARLLTVEILAVGTEGVRLQHEAIDQLATRLREAREPGGSSPVQVSSPEWIAVAAMVASIGRRVAEGERPEPTELEAICAHLLFGT
jgi:AcrR family transcriptional regulator